MLRYEQPIQQCTAMPCLRSTRFLVGGGGRGTDAEAEAEAEAEWLNGHGSERRQKCGDADEQRRLRKKATEQPRGGHTITGPRVQHQPACGTWLALPGLASADIATRKLPRQGRAWSDRKGVHGVERGLSAGQKAGRSWRGCSLWDEQATKQRQKPPLPCLGRRVLAWAGTDGRWTKMDVDAAPTLHLHQDQDSQDTTAQLVLARAKKEAAAAAAAGSTHFAL
ncbi:hypothetical protein B0T14DRAFT_36361 [Immersiella caudata]|uniref:Uncharacterized protein n=1 Tax=Immersiella caudata TaxID=314043 RepID=A0AA39XF38_9PEZI|nr:hypothetical protein B0T14DRAFT_36361 [Immersiella caudata]